MNYARRIQKLQKILRRKKLDAILVTQPENRRYLCGYTSRDHSISESSGSLLVCAGGPHYLLTDFRYELQAKEEVEQAQVLIYSKGLHRLLKEIASQHNLKRIGFESHYMLHASAAKLTNSLAKSATTLLSTTDIIEKTRLVKEESEIALIRKSVRLNERIFQEILPTISPGDSELDIAIQIENSMRTHGAEAPSFDTIVASAANCALPHAVPGNKPIEKNKPLMIDMGLILNGYCSDMTRTIVIGEVDDHYRSIHQLVRRAQLSAINLIRPGATMRDIDRAARSVITNGGYGKNFGHALGHGVGLAVHEKPRLSSHSRMKFKAGMVVTVEPGIYIPNWGGVRLENMVVVTDDGCEILNRDTTGLDIK